MTGGRSLLLAIIRRSDVCQDFLLVRSISLLTASTAEPVTRLVAAVSAQSRR